MQSLKLADDLFPAVLARTKRNTVRSGRRDIAPGPLAFEPTSGRGDPVVVNVVSVAHQRLRDLTDDQARRDGADTAAELAVAMRRFYPDIGPDDEITVVEFALPSPPAGAAASP